jgi:hypothetical protein
MKRTISLLLITLLLAQSAPLAVAQTDTTAVVPMDQTVAPPVDTTAVPLPESTAAPAPSPADTLAAPTGLAVGDTLDCRARGKSDGKGIKTGGSFAGGFAGGVLLGLIGTAIAIVAQSKPEPPVDKVFAMPNEACRQIYTQAYKSSGKGKKQSSALVGGLLGTAVIVTILVATSSSE